MGKNWLELGTVGQREAESDRCFWNYTQVSEVRD